MRRIVFNDADVVSTDQEQRKSFLDSRDPIRERLDYEVAKLRLRYPQLNDQDIKIWCDYRLITSAETATREVLNHVYGTPRHPNYFSDRSPQKSATDLLLNPDDFIGVICWQCGKQVWKGIRKLSPYLPGEVLCKICAYQRLKGLK